ncbi:MAG: GntR family transcriptional regulator [Anaerotardibacter sp.]
MFLSIDKMKSEPLYLQIRNQIVSAIAKGQLEPGDVLPSVRSLASDLGVNLHTVNKAYALLQDEGYVVMAGRSGTIIAERSCPKTNQEQNEIDQAIQETLRQIFMDYCAKGGTKTSFIALVNRIIEEGKER